MKRGRTGAGGALIVLVFTVLCLVIFTILSLSTAQAEKTMTDNRVRSVTAYYEADALAEWILSEIMTSEDIPDRLMGVTVSTDDETGRVQFACPMYGENELWVELYQNDGTVDIREWRIVDSREWEVDSHITVWTGE